MKQLAALLALALSACATLTADHEQEITVTTASAGMRCDLSNKLGNWVIEQTPGSAAVSRSFSPLMVECSKPGAQGFTRVIEAKTRGRAYGNILLLGVPAVVDASTGAGYEYDPASVTLSLTP